MSSLLIASILLPLLGATVACFLPNATPHVSRTWALAVTVATLVLVVILLQGFVQQPPAVGADYAAVNRAWLPAEAIRVMNSVGHLPVAFEQPCDTLDQCAAVRRRTTQPISIDERVETVHDMQRIVNEGIGEIVNIKIGRVGGLTRARKIRDIGIASGSSS